MKPLFLFLVVFVAVSSSNQQKNHRRLWFDLPWISLVGKPLNYYPLKTIRGYIGENIGRIGWSQLRNRLLYMKVASNKISQPQTATLTITSTCTSLTVSTCVPRANFLPRAPAQIINCRRKRQVDLDGSVTIVPSKILKVMATEGPHLESAMLGNRQIADSEIYSSKEEESQESSAFDSEISKTQLTMSNRKGFFHLKPSRTVNSVTVTTWSVVSSTFTSTFIPAADFLCVPPGYQICV